MLFEEANQRGGVAGLPVLNTGYNVSTETSVCHAPTLAVFC